MAGHHCQTIGHYGKKDGQFTQAAGIAVDSDGHIIIADSKMGRIQVISYISTYLTVKQYVYRQ